MPTETHQNRADWNSYTQFVYELIAGPVRRNTFTRWELDLMLDLESLQMRKSARAQLLRRYIKAVSQSSTLGAPAPPRLGQFLAVEMSAREENTNQLAPNRVSPAA